MKKNSYVYFLLLGLLLGAFLLAGCKKTTDTITTTTSDSGSQDVVGGDELQVNDEVEQAIDEAVLTLSISSTTSARVQNLLLNLIPGALIDTTYIANGLISIDYFGAEKKDNSKVRKGSIQIQLPLVAGKPVSWKTQGVGATITFPGGTNAYEITYQKNNTSLWMKGTITLVNYSGGLIRNLTPGDSVVEKLRGQISYTNNDNVAVVTAWTWNLHNTRVIGMASNGDTTITTRADTNVGGFTNVTTWGQTRFNNNFYTTMSIPVFRNLSGPGFYYPLSGTKLVNSIPEPLTITFGVDNNGNATSNSPFGFLLNWTNSSGAQQDVIQYY